MIKICHDEKILFIYLFIYFFYFYFFAFFEIKYMEIDFFFFSIYRMEYDTNASIQKKEL